MSRLRRLRRRPQFQSLDRRAVMDADGIELGLDNEPLVEVSEVAEVGDVADSDVDATPIVHFSLKPGDSIDESSPDDAVAVEDENAEIFQTMMFSLSGDDEDSILSDDESVDKNAAPDESGEVVPTGRGGIAPNFRTLGGEVDSEESEDLVDTEGSADADDSGDVVDLSEIRTFGAVGSDDSVDEEDNVKPEDNVELEDGELDPNVIFQTMGAPSDTPDDAPSDDSTDGELDPNVIFQTTGAPSDDTLEEKDVTDGEVVITTTRTRDFDVNGNGAVTSLDALLIINSLSRHQRQAGRAQARSMSASLTSTNSNLDVNKDSVVTSFDALLVINQVSRGHSSVRQGIAVGEPNGSTDDGSTQDESTDTIPTHDSRLAGYTTLTLAGLGSAPVVLTVNDNGDIEAVSDGESLEVKVGKDDSVTVDGQATPVRVLRLGDVTYLVPTSEDADDVTVEWPNAVDDVMAQWA